MNVRLRPSAAIIRDDMILLIEDDEPGFGLHYNLPGGGLEVGELLKLGLTREVREETGAGVEIGPLLLVWESEAAELGMLAAPTHTIMFVFECSLLPGVEPSLQSATAPGDYQVGVRWVTLDELPTVRLLPPISAELNAALKDRSPRDLYIADAADPMTADQSNRT